MMQYAKLQPEMISVFLDHKESHHDLIVFQFGGLVAVGNWVIAPNSLSHSNLAEIPASPFGSYRPSQPSSNDSSRSDPSPSNYTSMVSWRL